jgi:hypothetical protein
MIVAKEMNAALDWTQIKRGKKIGDMIGLDPDFKLAARNALLDAKSKISGSDTPSILHDFYCTCCPWVGSDTGDVICTGCQTVSPNITCDDICPECECGDLWDACPECSERLTTIEALRYKPSESDGEKSNDSCSMPNLSYG